MAKCDFWPNIPCGSVEFHVEVWSFRTRKCGVLGRGSVEFEDVEMWSFRTRKCGVLGRGSVEF